MKKITSLTEAQRAAMPGWAAKWIEIALSTAPADRPRFEAAVRTCYRAAGLAEPARIVWVPSPMALAREAERLTGKPFDFAYRGGQFWAGGWYGSPAFVSFFTDVCKLELSPKIAELAAAHRATVESGCWWWPRTNLVLASERPHTLSRDPAGRLHAVSGPAIAWEGFAIHCWHGTRVPADWIGSPDKVDPRLALTWKNIEQRRALAEIVGWIRVLEHVNVRVIDADPDPKIGTLIECDLPDSPRARFLRVTCATGREFALAVPEFYEPDNGKPDSAPRGINTAREANAWTYGLDSLTGLEVRT